ncbi:MAG: type II toxin-antitoxin system VapC family toxin [Phyllobacterium sp.]|uniref:type II toxin-antitoxin system VapC family toxin n=1 Tax=Phyllobacterium sp. TaxID=1871046 RepID=UPI0030F3509C
MTVVVDASIAAAWVLPDEQNADANAVLLRLNATGGVIPTLFWYEALNLCWLNGEDAYASAKRAMADCGS